MASGNTPAFLFGGAESPLPSRSLSSASAIRVALFFLGARFFLMPLGLSPPRVERARAKLFSWACSCAARRASASSTDEERLAFFLTGSGVTEPSESSWSYEPLVADRLWGEGSGTDDGGTGPASAPETASKRSSISFLIASYLQFKLV